MKLAIVSNLEKKIETFAGNLTLIIGKCTMICKAWIMPQRKPRVPEKKKFEAKLPAAIPPVVAKIVLPADNRASDRVPSSSKSGMLWYNFCSSVKGEPSM